MIDESYVLWIGNLTDADCTYEAMELFGFGRGAFELKEVRHNLTLKEPHVLCSSRLNPLLVL